MYVYKQIGEPSGACPSFFKGSCNDARNQTVVQGYRFSYADPARALIRNIHSEIDDDRQLVQLEKIIDKHSVDRKAVWTWFKTYLPKCSKLIPFKSRRLFVEALIEAASDDNVDLY